MAKKIEVKEIVKKEVKGKATFNHKVKLDLDFKKRSFHVGTKIVTLVAGEGISDEDYALFNGYCKKQFFE